MKKFIILLFSLLCLSSCAVSRIEDQRILPESGRLIVMERFEMDDHYYISFTVKQHQIGSGKYSTSVIHDPNCPCNNFFE